MHLNQHDFPLRFQLDIKDDDYTEPKVKKIKPETGESEEPSSSDEEHLEEPEINQKTSKIGIKTFPKRLPISNQSENKNMPEIENGEPEAFTTNDVQSSIEAHLERSKIYPKTAIEIIKNNKLNSPIVAGNINSDDEILDVVIPSNNCCKVPKIEKFKSKEG